MPTIISGSIFPEAIKDCATSSTRHSWPGIKEVAPSNKFCHRAGRKPENVSSRLHHNPAVNKRARHDRYSELGALCKISSNLQKEAPILAALRCFARGACSPVAVFFKSFLAYFTDQFLRCAQLILTAPGSSTITKTTQYRKAAAATLDAHVRGNVQSGPGDEGSATLCPNLAQAD